MKLPIICTIFFISSASLFAQTTLTFKHFQLFDDPIIFYSVDDVNPLGSSLSPQLNRTPIYTLEIEKKVGSRFAVLAGGGFGRSFIKVNYVSTDALLKKNDGSDISLWMDLGPVGFFTVYTGASVTQSISDHLDLRADLRVGVKTSFEETMIFKGSHGNADEFVYRGHLEVNYNNRNLLMIMPEFSLRYHFQKLPIAISLGASWLYSPGDHLGGHVILNGDEADYMQYLYDNLSAIGGSLSLSYVLH